MKMKVCMLVLLMPQKYNENMFKKSYKALSKSTFMKVLQILVNIIEYLLELVSLNSIGTY